MVKTGSVTGEGGPGNVICRQWDEDSNVRKGMFRQTYGKNF